MLLGNRGGENMHTFKVLSLLTTFTLIATVSNAQERMLSPRGQASTQVGGSWNADGKYDGGKWIDVDYGRPILRNRENIFGSGEDYGEGLLRGAPIWRVGANQSTRFKTEVDLLFGGQRLPAGEYSIFADTGASEWTLVFSTYGVKQTFREENPDALWGAYDYTPDRDVLRTPMTVQTIERSADQLVVAFTNMTQQGGDFTVWWDDQMATIPFTVAN